MRSGCSRIQPRFWKSAFHACPSKQCLGPRRLVERTPCFWTVGHAPKQTRAQADADADPDANANGGAIRPALPSLGGRDITHVGGVHLGPACGPGRPSRGLWRQMCGPRAATHGAGAGRVHAAGGELYVGCGDGSGAWSQLHMCVGGWERVQGVPGLHGAKPCGLFAVMGTQQDAAMP